MDRGLIISCPLQISGTKVFIEKSTLDWQELRIWLLFWDRLEWPLSNAIYIEDTSPETQFLMSVGILRRPLIKFSGGQGSDAIVQAYLQAFQEREAEEPGQWALAQGGRSLILPSGILEHGRGLQIELYRHLPVPDVDVPLEEILNFKAHRNPELLALRVYMDELVARVSSAGDRSFAKAAAKTQIVKALDDLEKAMDDYGLVWRPSKFRLQLKVSLDLIKALKLAAVGTGVAAIAGAPPLVGAIGGLALGALDLKLVPSLKTAATSTSPFAYIAEYSKTVAQPIAKRSA